MRACCGEEACIQRELSRLLEPDAPIVDRISVAACIVAQTCRNAERTDLEQCAARLFNVPPECELTAVFIEVYRAECKAIVERSESEKLRSMCWG